VSLVGFWVSECRILVSRWHSLGVSKLKSWHVHITHTTSNQCFDVAHVCRVIK